MRKRISGIGSTIGTAHAAALALLVLVPVTPAAARTYRPPASFARAAGDLALVDRRQMPPVDNSVLLAAADRLEAASLGAPLYVAYPFEVDLDLGSSGTWELLDDGSRLWRLRIHSPTALRLNLGFTRFGLPAGGISNGGALSRCRGWSDSADVFRVGRVRTGWPAFADGQARPPSAAGDGDEAPPGFEASAILPPEMARGPPRLELWLSGQVERSRQKLGELGRSVCEEAFRRLNEVETGKEHEE